MAATIRQLGKLQTLEVSLVPKGANKRRFALRKGDTMDEILKAVLELDLDNEEQIDKILKADGMSDKARAACKAMLKIATGFKDEMPADLMTKLAKLGGYAAEKVAKADGEIDFDSIPAAVRPQVEALWKSQREASERVAKAEATLKAERDERTTREYIAKAASDYATLPGMKADEIGPVLKALHEASPESAAKLEGVLKGAAEAIKAGELLKQVGRPTSGVSGSAWAEIEKLADLHVAKGDAGTSRASAVDAVLKTADGRALYQKYLAEHPAQTGSK